MGAVLQQYVDGTWHPISFLSKKMTPAETRYSTFDRELLAVYLATRHFRHLLEGQHFHVLTDHKPLMYALNTRSDRHSLRQARHLDYILQFTSTIRHVHGLDSVVADTLSRIALISGTPPVVDFAAMAKSQATDPQIRALQSSPLSALVVEPIPLPNSADPLYCDTSTGTQRPLVPREWLYTASHTQESEQHRSSSLPGSCGLVSMPDGHVPVYSVNVPDTLLLHPLPSPPLVLDSMSST